MFFFRKKAFAFLFIITLVLIFLFSPKAKSSVKIFFMQLFKAPLQVSDTAQKLPSKLPKGRLARENLALKEKINELEKKITDLAETEKENQRLRSLLELRKKKEFSAVAAQVIGRDSSIWSETAIIDKGSKSGIYANMVVVNSEGLVGRIIEVGPYVSRVLLITDPNSRVGGQVSQTREMGIIEGTVRSILKMRYINPDAQVKDGDEVVTSGVGASFKKGISIGKVLKVEMDRTRLYKFAYIKPSVNFGKLEEVLCIK